jgi:hypothetical protein
MLGGLAAASSRINWFSDYKTRKKNARLLKHYNTNIFGFISKYVTIIGDEGETIFNVVSAIMFLSIHLS